VGIAIAAPEVAACEPYKDTRQTDKRGFALNAPEDFVYFQSHWWPLHMGALRRWKPNVEKVIANDKIPYFGAVDIIIS
jgi:hypothetical protein